MKTKDVFILKIFILIIKQLSPYILLSDEKNA